MSPLAMAAAFFGVVLAGVLAAGWVVVTSEHQKPAGVREYVDFRSRLSRILQRLGTFIPADTRERSQSGSRLLAAGFYQPSALTAYHGVRFAFAVICAAAAAIVAQFSQVDLGQSLFATAASAIFGYIFPGHVLNRRVSQRRGRLRRALPAAIDVCVLSLEAGQTIDQALTETSNALRRSYPDLSLELQIVYIESKSAKGRTAALEDLAIRTGEPELRKFAGLLLDADRFGATVGTALRNHATYLRTRMRQKAQESARKVSAKLIFPIFFLIFPTVLLFTLGPAVIMIQKQLQEMLGNP